MTKVRGAHAIVTGGSSGIGLATARLLVAGGASVSLVARGADRLDQAALALGLGLGGTVRTAAVDVSDPVALRSAFEGFFAEGGPCDILVSAAGLARPGHFLELGDEVFRQMMEVDYFGTLQAIRLVAPGMVARGRGSIVAVSSGTALLGFFGYTAYAPAKFAVRGLMEALRAGADRSTCRLCVPARRRHSTASRGKPLQASRNRRDQRLPQTHLRR
ncbi:SDR family NAD(P)-dependent oxidoreductase [Kribbella sp. NPDC006257]|uniref:SDR family NAD(P)-dependent oxidoreductase n=1 Tax=Kribbella sp. NPDC006257 TaxID=3156738 RepID=UPI0033A7961E